MRFFHSKSRRDKRPPAVICGFAAAAVLALAAAAEPAPSSGGALASAGDYIVRFVQYVRWPADEGIQAWQVCIAAGSSSKAAAYADRTSRGRPFATRAVAPSDSLANCQVLDLTDTPPADAKALLLRARPLAILTVGEGEGFCSAGGIACLRTQTEAGGFEINLSAVQQARLAVNPQLLMLGRRRLAAGSAQ